MGISHITAVIALVIGMAFWLPATTARAETDDSDVMVFAASEGDVLSNVEMEQERGAAAENNLSSSQSLVSTTTGNSVTAGGNLTTGMVNVGDNFGGSGFGSYVFNTGNNTSINSAVSVSIQMTSGL